MMKISINHDSSGEVMLESLIVYTVTIFLLFLILAIFSVLYQGWNIQTIANETASKAAQTYKLTAADFSTGDIQKGEITKIREYRYLYKSENLVNDVSEKIKNYATTRLSNTTYAQKVNEPEINVEVVHDALARRHLELTIKGEYTVPFGQVFSYFGIQNTTVYEKTARADCVDMIDYINTTDFVAQKSSLSGFDSSFVKMINKTLSLFHNIFSQE